MKRAQWLDKLGDWFVPVTETGCWLWMRAGHSAGYGKTGRGEYAHRVSYETMRGPISPELEIDHLCRVRCCVNPDHLEVVSQRVNILRGQSMSARYARRSHCANGHELSPGNLYPVATRPNTRVCRECTRARKAKRWIEQRKR